MRQTEIRRPWTGLCRCSDSTDSGSEEGAASRSHSLSVSGILHWREGRRRKWWWRVGCGSSEVSTATPPPLRSPSMSLPKHSSLALKLADSASFLSVLKQDRTTLCLTQTISQTDSIQNTKTTDWWWWSFHQPYLFFHISTCISSCKA